MTMGEEGEPTASNIFIVSSSAATGLHLTHVIGRDSRCEGLARRKACFPSLVVWTYEEIQ
jgi:hypothetical protein